MAGPLDDPIGRLANFLIRCTDVHESRSCREMWALHLNLENRLTPELWRGIALMAEQPGRARTTVGHYNGEINAQKETVLREIDRAEATINAAAISLDQSISVVRGHYDLGTVMALQVAGNAMGPAAQEPVPGPDALERIESAANELIRALRAHSSIEISLKRILFEHAEAVLSALNLIAVGGAKLLVDERDRLTGRLVADPNIAAQVTKSPSVRTKVLGVLNALLLVTNVSHNTLQLPHDFSSFLSLTAPEEHIEAPAAPDTPPTSES